MLFIENIEKEFCSPLFKKRVVALSNINLVISEGEITGLLGHNGAGKTTLLRIICNLIFPSKGQVRYETKQICPVCSSEIVRFISIVLSDNKNLYWHLSADENIDYLASLKGLNKNHLKDKRNELYELVGLKGKEKKLVQEFSSGMKQKLALVLALISEPEILILDEPLFSLDYKTSKNITDYLRNYANKFNRIVIIASHQLDFIEGICDRIAVLKQGKLIYFDAIDSMYNKTLDLPSDYFELKIDKKTVMACVLDEMKKKQDIFNVDLTDDKSIIIKLSSSPLALMGALKTLEKEHGVVTDISQRKTCLNDFYRVLHDDINI